MSIKLSLLTAILFASWCWGAEPTPADSRIRKSELEMQIETRKKAIAEEEKAIRKDPVGAAGNLAKKAFGALGQ